VAADEQPAAIFAEEAPAVSAAPAERAAPAASATVGEFLGQAGRTNWSPEDMVAALMQRPEIDGAVVALQEGLVVAHQLPEGMKGEVFAAFLPQVFARLNLYCGEMKLGSVEDLMITAAGGQCQLFRIGQIYFAVLAKLGATLPARELRLCAHALV
jgi:predicted regulator of Ras-like GTPase activity (Roadblock/LC7/MglB family)